MITIFAAWAAIGWIAAFGIGAAINWAKSEQA